MYLWTGSQSVTNLQLWHHLANHWQTTPTLMSLYIPCTKSTFTLTVLPLIVGTNLAQIIWTQKQHYWQYVMSHTRVVIVVSCKLATYKAAWEQGQLVVRAGGCNLSVHKVKVGPEALFRKIYLPYLASHQCGSHTNRFWESVLLQLLLAVIVNTCQSCYVFSPLTLSPLITEYNTSQDHHKLTVMILLLLE